MSVTPNTNSKYSGVEKPTHLTHAKKSLISRACSSPSIVSLYQEPFIEPSDTVADNILGTQNPPGNNSEISNKPVINQPTKIVYNNHVSKQDNVPQKPGTKLLGQTGNDEFGRYDLKQMITKMSKNEIEQLVGKLSKPLSSI